MNRPPYRIGRRGAWRLLGGDPAARAAVDARMAALLEALAPETSQAPDASDTPDALGAPRDRRTGARSAPPEILAAFARQAAYAESAARGHRARSGARGTRSRRMGRSLAVKSAVLVLALSGGTMAAAAADALPGPAQRAAHKLFGSWGVPAPSTPPRRHGPDPAPNTGSVLPEGTVPAAAPPTASPRATDTGSGVATTQDASPCVTLKHGNGRHKCSVTGMDTSGDEDGNGNKDKNGDDDLPSASSSTAVSAVPALPIPTPTPTPTVHVPPGRVKKSSAPDAQIIQDTLIGAQSTALAMAR